MNYLFYDLECASCAGGGKICEFGYVLTDGSFRLLEKANLLINPGIGPGEWDWFALKKVLTHSRPEYEAQKKFPHYADKIRALFEGAVAVGHTIDGDAQYLLDECARYGVKAWDYRYVDIRAVDIALAPGEGRALSKIAEACGCPAEVYHDALADAETGLAVCRRWTAESGETPEAFFGRFPSACGIVADSRIFLMRGGRMLERGVLTPERHNEMRGANKKIFRLFCSKYHPKKPARILKGKRIFLDPAYTQGHYRESLALARKIADFGGKIAMSAAHCDEYVFCFQPPELSANEEGNLPAMREFSAFLREIGLDQADLSLLPAPDLSFLNRYATILSEEEIISFLKNKKAL